MTARSVPPPRIKKGAPLARTPRPHIQPRRPRIEREERGGGIIIESCTHHPSTSPGFLHPPLRSPPASTIIRSLLHPTQLRLPFPSVSGRKIYARFGKARVSLALKLPAFYPSGSPSSRRSVEKRVVSVPLAECGDRPRGASGEGPPPSDSWAWRKYGQKPIKGSPYPRGYYRCSSSKGCPARKQVERSRADPTVLLVTYTFEHNHPWPQPKSSSGTCHQQGKPSTRPPAPKPEPAAEQAELGPELGPELEPPEAEAPEPEPEQEEQEQKAVESLPVGPETATVAPAAEEDESFDFAWFDHQYPTWHRSALYAPLLPPEEWERELQGEDALFAGLGELPECAVVFGRRRELSLAATAPCS